MVDQRAHRSWSSTTTTPCAPGLMRAFTDRGLEARGAASAEEAVTLATADSPELAVVDLRMPGSSGLQLVRELVAIDRATRVVVLTGYGSIATALEAIRLGAVHYLTKPADAEQILAAFERPTGEQRAVPKEKRAKKRSSPSRSPRSPAPSGSTSSASSPTAAATSPRPRASSASTAAACSASSPSTRCPLRAAPNMECKDRSDVNCRPQLSRSSSG